MKLLGLDVWLEHDDIENEHYNNHRSAFDFDAVVWRPGGMHYLYWGDSKYQGLPCLSENNSHTMKSDIEWRLGEFDEFLKLGRTVVIFTPAPQTVYVWTKSEYQGSGKSRQRIDHVKPYNMNDAIPGPNCTTVYASGRNISFIGQSPFKEFWHETSDLYDYDAYFSDPIGTPLFKITGTDKVLGAHLRVHSGNLIFLPAINTDDDDIEGQEKFVDSLIELISSLNSSCGELSLPTWAALYDLPGEERMRSTIAELEQQLEQIRYEIARESEAIEKYQTLKILFTGTGRALEIKVKEVFEHMGFEVAEGERGRDDLILKNNGRVAVVEVKGLTKSAKEQNAAQLEKWVSQYVEAHETIPKGILVVNAFKDVELKSRTEPSFPDQMLSYSTSRNHCLMTGLQLLCIYMEVQRSPERLPQIIDSIFNTNGVFEGYSDWGNYIVIDEARAGEQLQRAEVIE